MRFRAAWPPVKAPWLSWMPLRGIEAQTLANVYLAMEHDLKLIPVVNKIDLPSAEPERVAHEIERVLGLGMDRD